MQGKRVRRPKVWRGEVNDCPPSANVYMRLHFRERKALKDRWYLELYSAFAKFGGEGLPDRARKRRHVRVVVTSKQQRDHANLWLGVDKLIHDNLTKLGWIADDCPNWMTPVVEGVVGTPHTLIEIREGDGL